MMIQYDMGKLEQSLHSSSRTTCGLDGWVNTTDIYSTLYKKNAELCSRMEFSHVLLLEIDMSIFTRVLWMPTTTVTTTISPFVDVVIFVVVVMFTNLAI